MKGRTGDPDSWTPVNLVVDRVNFDGSNGKGDGSTGFRFGAINWIGSYFHAQPGVNRGNNTLRLLADDSGNPISSDKLAVGGCDFSNIAPGSDNMRASGGAIRAA